ncbi:hypothetical protein BT96DRAFT_1013796 [Gymnopus androsaceus JB14]|uniref:GH16 domain-containing protein n=1 Tax=Gymnopus androsaceus JB14 TaxID=1447944 RepID=A0A6A4IH00_9AGAR|nr:hypothetical protein BT96DRAFT_1013796 [Gymnopus androsaceus JB14]
MDFEKLIVQDFLPFNERMKISGETSDFVTRRDSSSHGLSGNQNPMEFGIIVTLFFSNANIQANISVDHGELPDLEQETLQGKGNRNEESMEFEPLLSSVWTSTRYTRLFGRLDWKFVLIARSRKTRVRFLLIPIVPRLVLRPPSHHSFHRSFNDAFDPGGRSSIFVLHPCCQLSRYPVVRQDLQSRVSNLTEFLCSNETSPCPASEPCCSEYGFCGRDSFFCLGGCNPLLSHSLDSCKPNPLCEDATYTFANNSRILTNASQYDGNAAEYDWVVDKGSIINTNSSGGELGLILTETNGGTRLSSTRYIHYWTISATPVKTGRWAGVVTAFITMSDIKDEIDWEFPGANTTTGQTNYYWQGVIPNVTHGAIEAGLADTFSNYHEYTIDWQPAALTFSIDGNVVRTINESDAIDATTGLSEYPNTPSRIQLSLWPAGINTSAPGTVQWSGGMINWQDPDYISAGHFYALVQSVTVKCADPQSPGVNITSYIYGSNQTTDTPSIAFSNETILLNGASSKSEGFLFGMIGFLEGRAVSWLVAALMVMILV